jgi:acetyl esterase/lipase
MRTLLLVAITAALAISTVTTTSPTSRPVNGEPMRLWKGKAPRALGDDPADIPMLIPFLTDSAAANGTAVVICPGGGYAGLTMDYEGTDVAKWFNKHGVAAFVLKYRVNPYGQPAPMLDGQRAVRTVRHNAAAWGIDPYRIGIMGFSAGGHVASTVGVHYDFGIPATDDPVNEESCRPDFMLLIYPVITMRDKIAHEGSKHVLLGDKPPQKLVTFYSNETQVTEKTPPAFIVHSKTDPVVQVKNSQLFAEALKKHDVPVEYLELPTGGHGYGMAAGDPKLSIWTDKCLEWMKGRGLLAARKAR